MQGGVILEDHPPIVHSAANGILARYQSRLTEQLNHLLNRLAVTSQAIASEANADITSKVHEFEYFRNESFGVTADIVENAGTSNNDYEDLKHQVQESNQAVIDRSIELRSECLSIYETSFKKLQPEIDAIFEESAEWRPQLPEHVAHRLEYEVHRLNRRYLETRKSLVLTLYEAEMSSRARAEEFEKELEAKRGDWMTHRHATSVEATKLALDIANRIDFGTLFEDFYRDQQKFTRCFKKNMQNVQLIAPPEHFSAEDLNRWWTEVTEVLEMHRNFVKIFLDKVKEKVDERSHQNQEMMTNLREQLVKLTDEKAADEEIAWLLPRQRLSDKYNNTFFERLNLYWTNREEALTAAFSSVKEFLEKLIHVFYQFNGEVTEDRKKMEEDMGSYDEEMKEKIEECENKIKEKVAEVNGAVSEKEIKAGIDKCKVFLNEIADQYRSFYMKCIDRIDKRRPFVMDRFEEREQELLEHLKMKKTAGPDEARADAAKTKKKPTSPRSPKRLKSRDASLPPLSFKMMLGDGSKYEEEEPLLLIPATEDFIDEDPEPVSARGKKGKKPPPRKPAKRKGKQNEPEELEMPEFKLFDVIPVIDGKPAIWVYIPEPSELEEYANPFRTAVVNRFHEVMTEAATEADYVDLRRELSTQLQERIRMHAPRTASMDLNVGEARISQLETRKIFIEKYFKQTSANFNKDYVKLKASIEQRKEKLASDCQELRKYVDNLGVQKNSRNLAELTQQYRAHEKSFDTMFQKVIQQMFSDISAVSNAIKGSNDRFMASVESKDPPFSTEEKELCTKYLERMNEGVNALLDELNQLTQATQDETEASRTEISQEYERLLPHHKMDLEFLESLARCQAEARSRYDSLCFKNRQSENDVILALNRVHDAQTLELPPQELINKQFEVIDLFRLIVIRRAKFLGILKSNISSEPILISIDLSAGGDGLETPEARKKRLMSKQKSRSPGRQTTPSNQPPRSESPPLDLSGTLRSLIDMIGSDMMDQVRSISGEYYKKVKVRKFQITRAEIPNEPKDCLSEMKMKWEKIISNSDSIVQSSGEKLAGNVLESVKVVRESVRVIFDAIYKHYCDAISESEAELRKNFQKEIKAYAMKWETLKGKLTPQLSDPNQISVLKELVSNEQARAIEEANLLSSYYNTLIETENDGMRQFTSHLPVVVKAALQMFDGFVMGADLVNGRAENAERMTIMQMLKDQSRRENGKEPFDEKRPFRRREWPQLNVVMPGMEQVLMELGKTTSAASSRRGRKTATQKQKDEAEPEKTAQQTSLDTGLNRGVIVEQNRVYEQYEQELNNRLASLKSEYSSAKLSADERTGNWRLCVLSLRPDWVFPPV